VCRGRTHADVPLRPRGDPAGGRRYEEQAKNLDRDSAAEISAFAAELGWFHSMVRVHEDAEEQVLFPALNQRHVYLAESYAFDHDDFEPHVFDGLDHALSGLQRAQDDGQRRESAELLYRQSVALNEHMRLHISKENELLVPKVESEFDLDEQVRIAGTMGGLFEPPMIGALVAWMYEGQDAADREGMIRFLSHSLPAEAFTGLGRMLAAKDPSAWVETTLRIPELASTTQ
jgi:zinc finger protein-like protein